MQNEKFVVREFQEVEGGRYDEMNFYFTPNGSNFYYLKDIRFLGS